MTASLPQFDLSEYPLVWQLAGAAADADAPRWIAELEALLARRQNFVLLFDMAMALPPAQRGVQIAWQLAHTTELAEYCVAWIAVEADPLARQRHAQRAVKMTRALGMQFLMAADAGEAEQLGHRLLGVANSC